MKKFIILSIYGGCCTSVGMVLGHYGSATNRHPEITFLTGIAVAIAAKIISKI